MNRLNLNFLILIKINLFDSNWCNAFRKINVVKTVNKLCFDQNNKKVGKNSLFSFLFKYFQETNKRLGKALSLLFSLQPGYCSIQLFWIVNPIQIYFKYVIYNPNPIFKMD